MKKSQPAPKRYMTVAEASEYLALSRDTIYRLLAARRIPFVAVNISASLEGREPLRTHYRFDQVELDKFMARNAVIPPEALNWHMPKVV